MVEDHGGPGVGKELENEQCVLVFEGGGDSGGGGICKEQPPTKTSRHGSFSRVVVGVGKE